MPARIFHHLSSAGLVAVVLSTVVAHAQQETRVASDLRPNMVGAYGPWLSEKILGDGPARLSFRTGKWKSLDEWRHVARVRLWECMAPVDLGGQPEVRIESIQDFDGL